MKMDVQLEILQGRLKQGKTEAGVNRFSVRLSRFVIGSDPACHMVCKSRTISDRHCLILVAHGDVQVRDLGSQAGTFINDVPVEGTQRIAPGDKLRIGRLDFRLLLGAEPPAAASLSPPPLPPPVPPPRVAPDQPTAETVVGTETVDALVTDILQQEDEAAREARLADPAARYFRTDHLRSTDAPAPEPDPPPRKLRPVKKSVGKLPPPPPIQANDSVTAAEKALEELFQPPK